MSLESTGGFEDRHAHPWKVLGVLRTDMHVLGEYWGFEDRHARPWRVLGV